MADTALVWFRRDLRVHDHPPLTAAARGHERVVGVFVLDERLLGGRFPSQARAWFLHESLRELRRALRDRGGELVVRHGKPERELPALARELGARAVHFASDVSPFAMARDRRVVEALGDVEAVRHPGNFVADVNRPRTKDGRPFVVFSPFWRAWRALPRRAVHGAPRRLNAPARLRGRRDPGHGVPAPRSVRARREGRARAHARLRARRARGVRQATRPHGRARRSSRRTCTSAA